MTNNDSLINVYRRKIKSAELVDDNAQRIIVEKLNLLDVRSSEYGEQKKGFARALFGWGREKVQMSNLQGLYIYGSVGRGKSMLMNLFTDCIRQPAWRVHFIEFMQYAHQQLDEARSNDIADPLKSVAKQISDKYRFLCLDEMQIENIADAMIVGRLFESLFRAGTILVTTSNRHPNDLYKGGLNRKRFLPFIDEIMSHCEVLCLDSPTDYRQEISGRQAYYYPLDESSLNDFEFKWRKVTNASEQNAEISLGGRAWKLARTSNDAVYLNFSDACEAARGARDYQAIADKFSCVFLDEVPILSNEKTSAVSRFIMLIDVFYEAKIELYLRMECEPKYIHQDSNTAFIWERTFSRLSEMAGHEWPMKAQKINYVDESS